MGFELNAQSRLECSLNWDGVSVSAPRPRHVTLARQARQPRDSQAITKEAHEAHGQEGARETQMRLASEAMIVGWRAACGSAARQVPPPRELDEVDQLHHWPDGTTGP